MNRRDGTGWVYELIDPRTDECRYVGCTLDFEKRKQQHLGWTVQNRKLDDWKREVHRDGYEPEVRIIEADIPRSALRERELQWCQERVFRGFDLLNMPSGRITKADLFPASDSMICLEHADEILGVINEILERCGNMIPAKALKHLWKAQQSVFSFKYSLARTP